MNKKKLLALLMALVMTLTLVPVTALAEGESAESDDVARVEYNGSVVDTYQTLQAAFAAATEGDTIVLLKDVTQDDGIIFDKDTSVGIEFDLNTHTLTVNSGSNANNRAIRIDKGTLEVYNGTIVAVGSGTTSADGAGCYGAFRVEANGILNAHDLRLTNARPWGLNVKVLGGEATLTNVTINSSYGGGIEVTEADLGEHSKPGTATLTNCTFTQTGYFDHCSTCLSVSGGSELVINSGSYSGENYVLYVFSSGGVIEVNGGTFTDTDTANRDAIVAAIDTNSYPEYTGGLDISGGLFTGNFAVTSPAYMVITGGHFTANPDAYLAVGYEKVNSNESGYTWTVQPEATPVAQIGETKYETLQAAIDAAQNGATITLLTDVSDGSGLIVRDGQPKNITIDFNTYTYTMKNPSVGSTGTETQALHFSDNSTVTLKNGTFRVAEDAVNVKMLMQNYAALTIEDMIIDGTSVAVRNYDNIYTGEYAIFNGTVIPQFNFNRGSATIRNSTISLAGDVSICSPVSIDGSTVIQCNKIVTKGTDERYASDPEVNISIENGAKFSDSGVATILASAQTLSEKANDLYTVIAKPTYVAQIGDNQYTTLAAAFAAANAGDTVKLLKDVDATDAMYSGDTRYNLWIKESITFDGDGHTLTVQGRGIGVQGASSKIDVTFKDVTIENGTSGARCIDTRGNLNSLTLDHVTLSTNGATSGYTQPLTIGGNQSEPATINITDSTIQTKENATAYYAIITFNPVNMNITNSTIKGWACIYAKGKDGSEGSHGSEFNITDSTLVSRNIYNGATNEFAAVVIEDQNVGVNITRSDIEINSNSDQSQAIALSYYLNSVVALGVGNSVTLSGDNAVISLVDASNTEITGGIFNVEPDALYIADGYKAVALTTGDNAGKFQVGPAEIQTTVNSEADKLTYNVNSVVKESTESDVEIETTNNLTVTVEGTDSEKTNSDGSSVGAAALENIKEEERVNIVKAAVEAAGSSITSDTEEANIVIQLAKSAPEKETNKVTFEVHPEAVITVAGSNKSTTVALSNEQLDNTKPFTFTLDVSALGVANGDSVKVTHKHGSEDTVLGDSFVVTKGKITITNITSFSEFIVEKVDNTDPESPTVTLTFNGTSLRRRVRLEGSMETTQVVRSSTDARFGYTWDLPVGYSVNKEDSLFEWSRDGKAWKSVSMTNFNGNTANLVITGIPDVAFDTPIYTRFTLAYTNGSDNGSITLTADARSVRDVANSLKGLTRDVDDNNKWIDYARYLLCDGINSYSIIDDGNGYDAQ